MSPVMLFVLAGLVVFAGAAIQGSAGLGMNLLAAPLLALLNPDWVPVPLLPSSLILAILTARREFSEVDWRGASLAIAGRVLGTALGVAAVALLPQRQFAAAVGALVLLCLLISVIRWKIRPTPASLLTAGFLGGALGTASSIGAPPVALVYQYESGPRIRATLAVYMTFGSFLSLVALGASGQIGQQQAIGAGVLLPFMAVGFVVSGPLRRYLDAGWMRPCVLLLAGSSALALLARGIA